jgi:hypothetical protein
VMAAGSLAVVKASLRPLSPDDATPASPPAVDPDRGADRGADRGPDRAPVLPRLEGVAPP